MNYTFKILYAIGMIMIVAGHCGNGGIDLLYDWFPPYAVHLGLFMFSSGYFYKDKAEEAKRSFVWKKVKSLLIPLYLWNFVYGVIVLVLSKFGFTIGAAQMNFDTLFVAPIMHGHQFAYNMGGWFVIPLFMVQVYNLFLRYVWKRIFKNLNEYIYFGLNLLIGIAGVGLAIKGYNTGWWLVLVRAMYFVPFYSLGILYNRKLEKLDKVSNTKYLVAVFLMQFVIICKFGTSVWYVPSWCNNFYNGPVMPYIAGFLGIAFWLRIAKILEPLIGKHKWVHAIADNTYTIMINQFLGFMMVKTIFAFANKFIGIFSAFDWNLYKTDIWYYYLIKGAPQTHVIYLVAGIVVPIIMQKIVNYLISFARREKE